MQTPAARNCVTHYKLGHVAGGSIVQAVLQAEAWYRISSYLSSMAALAYNPLAAIQIALACDAANMIEMRHANPASRET